MLPICRDPAAPMPDPLPDFLYPAAEIPREGLYLWQDSDGLALCKAGEKGRVRVDFAAGAAQYRQHKGGGELIAKAVNHTAKPLVWDATGWGAMPLCLPVWGCKCGYSSAIRRLPCC